MSLNSPQKKKRNSITSYSYTSLGAKKENITQKEYEKKKERIERENAKKQICLNCNKVCKTGICEFFPHG